MSQLPFGWWLTQQDVKVYGNVGPHDPNKPKEIRTCRRAVLFTQEEAMEVWVAKDKPLDAKWKLIGLTSDPRDVIAWINDGVIPPKEAPVRGS